jgi:hypothetical protein
MITNTGTRALESTIQSLEETKYTFDPNNMRHIAAILREMYSDPVMAVVREYSANAVDSHVFCGKSDTPIDIVVPTRDHPVFEVRDFGTGLSDEDVKKLLFGYASSGAEKRTSNELIGGFGIGAKSGYAVADQFRFISRHKGIQSTWLCYRDQDDDCRAKKIGECPTVFDDGLEVSIPIPLDLIDDFHKAISTAFTFYKVKPKLLGAPDMLKLAVNREIPKPVFSGTVTIVDKNGDKVQGSWDFISGASALFKPYENTSRYSYRTTEYPTSYVVMGQVAYPLDFSKIDMADRKLTGYILRVPIGSLQLAPSRESLSYTSRVKETLKGVIQVTMDTVEKQIHSKLATATSSHDLFNILNTVEENLPPDLRKALEGKDIKAELFKRGLTWTGYQVESKHFENVIVAGCRNRWMRGRYDNYFSVSEPFSGTGTTAITAGKFAPIVCLQAEPGEKLPRYPRELLGLVGTHLYPNMNDKNGTNITKEGRSFYVLVCRSDNVPDIPWLKDGSIKTVKFSDLPAKADDTWLVSLTTQSAGRRSSGSSSRNSYAQHSKKFAKLKNEPATYGSTKSDHWIPVAAKDLKDIEGKLVYTLHERFSPWHPKTSSLTGVYTAYERLLAMDSDLFPELQHGVFGIRKGDKEWVDKQDNLINIVDYLKEAVADVMDKYDVTLEQLRACFTVISMVRHRTEYSGLMPWILGASRYDNDSGLCQYLDIFRQKPELYRFVTIFTDTVVGSLLRDEFGFSLPFHRKDDKNIWGDKAIRTGSNKVLFDFVERCMSTELRDLWCKAVDSKCCYDRDSIDGLYIGNSKKQYQLFLEMEKLGL